MSNAPAAGHALRILSHLATRVEPVPAAHIARELGLPRSSTYHLLAALVEHGYVIHYADDQRYGLGIAAYELSSGYQRQSPLQRLARPIVQKLVDTTTHNGHLVVLHGRDVLYLIEERAPGRPLLVTDVGVRLPAPMTASGMAMLASLSAQQVRAVFPNADALTGGPSSLADLRRELATVRRRGYALEEGSVTPGLSSVAHAVLDGSGHPVAALALTFPSGDATDVDGLAGAVRAAAAQLSRRLS